MSDTKRVLLLGAGFVTGPIVDYFGRIPNVHVTAASALQSDLDRLIAAGPHVSPVVCDVQANPEALETLVRLFIKIPRPLIDR
jgi:alpha-aminoadipic semialdehyde synthase